MAKKDDVSKWPVPAFLLMGIGFGFLFLDKWPLAIPAFTLIGLGLGLLITFLTSRNK
jgi:hypothetical protein